MISANFFEWRYRDKEASLSNMYQTVYTLPLSYTVVLLLLAAVIFRIAANRIRVPFLFRGACLLMFFAWIYVVLDITLFSRSVGKHDVFPIPFNQLVRYLSGENDELLRSFWMNVLMFVPCGFFLPKLIPNSVSRKMCLILTIGFAVGLSVIVEAEQWYRLLGEAETDDVIANTLGALLGFYLTVGRR